jgi:hypothetical protein
MTGLLKEYGYEIDFAHRTFSWSNDSAGKAAVHCVIIGFSMASPRKKKRLWEYKSSASEPIETNPDFISAYLLDGPDVLVNARKSPFDVKTPPMLTGNEPRDGGFLSNLSAQEAEIIRQTDPIAAKYLRIIIGSDELLNGVGNRFCLWLLNAPPVDLSSSKELKSRVASVRANRLTTVGTKSSKARTADTPYLFSRIAQPSGKFIAIPSVSSEKRDYIPIDFFENDVIINNRVYFIPTEDLVYFALIENKVFTAWVRTFSSRMKSDYMLAAGTIYNTFPFPHYTEGQAAQLRTLAQEVLSTRNEFQGTTLGDLYDPLIMPLKLLKAHKELDVLILKLYGINPKATEEEILSKLILSYSSLCDSTIL